MKHLTETEREISEAAIRAYKDAIRHVWLYPESKWLDEMKLRMKRSDLRDAGGGE